MFSSLENTFLILQEATEEVVETAFEVTLTAAVATEAVASANARKAQPLLKMEKVIRIRIFKDLSILVSEKIFYYNEQDEKFQVEIK